MTDEYIDKLNSSGERTGEKVLKSDAHLKGYWHLAAHIWIYTPSGQILLQHRTDFKDLYPNLWDLSVGGHVEFGEDVLATAVREMEEEIGLKVEQNRLKKVGVMTAEMVLDDGRLNNEFQHVYLLEHEVVLDKLVLQEDEIDRMELIGFEKFKKEVLDNEQSKKYVPHKREYFEFVLKELEHVC